jgi:hypothetical protein
VNIEMNTRDLCSTALAIVWVFILKVRGICSYASISQPANEVNARQEHAVGEDLHLPPRLV